MTLKDIENIIDYTFDIADEQIDASFYIELCEISDTAKKQLRVTRIQKDIVTVDLVGYIENHRGAVRKYINNNYYDGEQKDYLMRQLCEEADTTSDCGEALAHFIENEMYYFLQSQK